MNSSTTPEQIDLSREPPFRLGAVEFRPSTREVFSGEKQDVLEPRVMQVLVVLARRRGETVSRDELIVSCWAGRVVSDDAIHRSISRVRAVSENFGGFTLETVPRVGYRLTEIASTPQPVQNEEPPKPWVIRHWRLLAALCAVFLILATGTAYWVLRPASHAAKFTIAVLPFTPPQGDREAEQLSDAIATAIADALAHEGMDVISPAKARQFRGTSKAEAAQALKADFVIDGEIRRDSGVVKATVRVIEGASGTTLFADPVQTPAADVSALPEQATVAALSCGWGLLPGLNPATGWDLGVIAGSLKVVKHLPYRSEVVYAYGISKQLALSAPREPYAQYLLAMSAADFMPDRLPDQRLPLVLEARSAAGKALELDPEFGEAYAALSKVTPVFKWTVRESYLKRGIFVRPSSPLAYMNLLVLRMSAGYLRQGAYMAEEAYANHAGFINTTFAEINARLWLGNSAAARLLTAKAMKLYPRQANFRTKMFEATAFHGALDEADALLKDPDSASLLEPQGEGMTYATIVSALRHGRAVDGNAVAADCMKVRGRTDEFRQICFEALVKLGRLDDAFRLADLIYPDQRGANAAEIERRWLAHIPLDTAYLTIPETAPLRADPRYRDVVERLGLLRFWKERGVAPDFCAVEKAPVCVELKS